MGMPRAGRPQAAGARGNGSLAGQRQEQRPSGPLLDAPPPEAAVHGQGAHPKVFLSRLRGGLAQRNLSRCLVPRQRPQSLGRRTQCHQVPVLVLFFSGPVFLISGRGGAGPSHPKAPWRIPRNLAKNSLPPGRLPGLLPYPAPCGP